MGYIEKGSQLFGSSPAALERIGAKFPLCIAQRTLAGVLLARGDWAGAIEAARKCLKLAAAERYIQISLSYRQTLLPALSMGLKYGIELDFLGDIVRRLGDDGRRILAELSATAMASPWCSPPAKRR